ncbi:MAG: oligosaccharide flippase family protein [Daejeonella sp.]
MIKLKQYIFHKQAINFVNYYIFTIINAVISVLSISYLTKHIPVEDYGRIGIFSSIFFFTPSLVTFCANGLQAIEIVDLNEEGYLKFRNEYITFVLLNSLFFVALACLISLIVPDFGFVIISATVMGLIQAFVNVHNTELFQNSQAARFGLISTATVLSSFLLTFLFISIFNLDWKFRIIALILAEFLVLIFRFYFFSSIGKKFSFHINKLQFKFFMHYGSPLILTTLAGWAINQSDRFFLLHYFSLKEVGIYAAAGSIVSFIAMINGNMIKVIYPLVFKKLSKREGRKFILMLTLIYLILILLITAVFCLVIYFFGHLILGAKYQDAYPIIYIMCFGQAFFGIYGTTGIVIDYFKRTKLKTVLILTASILIVVFSFILINILGDYGPAIASVISFVFLAVASFVIVKRLFNTYEIV